MNDSLLRLWNGVYSDSPNVGSDYRVDTDAMTRQIRNGYVLHPAIKATPELMSTVEGIVGLSGEKANQTFHKNWQLVRDAPLGQLWLQQALHYLTVYGFEAAGVYDETLVYIPAEELDIPDTHLPLVVIQPMSLSRIYDEFNKLASSTIALSQQVIDDLVAIVESDVLDFSAIIHTFNNRELKARISDYYGRVPTEPVEFLRHLIAKLTDESLLIKNSYLIAKIKEANGKLLDELLRDAPLDLASIFFRYKPLFLAMKSISRTKRGYFNRLRKQANKMHRPLSPDYLNSVTGALKNGKLDLMALRSALHGATIWRKIRLANALKVRLTPPSSIVYRVRNGRGWVENFSWPADSKVRYRTEVSLEIVLDSIAQGLRETVEGKTIYIPHSVCYAMPATEKQFVGHIPSGSYAEVPEDLITGIHWVDTEQRVDLDLSIISIDGRMGWGSSPRSGDALYSGDVTSAPKPNGATELFYIKQGMRTTKLLVVNYYNFRAGDEVECKVLVARETPKRFGNNYTVNPANVIAAASVTVTEPQTALGVIVNTGIGSRVYFTKVSIGNDRVSGNGARTEQVREYLIKSLQQAVKLESVLARAGAHVVYDKPLEGDYLDLSPETLTRSTFIELMGGS